MWGVQLLPLVGGTGRYITLNMAIFSSNYIGDSTIT